MNKPSSIRGQEKEWIDKWDAEIMWWFYDILENELQVTWRKVRKMSEDITWPTYEMWKEMITEIEIPLDEIKTKLDKKEKK